MARDIVLTEGDIELLREACSARGGVIRVDPAADLQARVGRTASALHLSRLGYFEAVPDGWRIKPALRKQVAKVLREHG